MNLKIKYTTNILYITLLCALFYPEATCFAKLQLINRNDSTVTIKFKDNSVKFNTRIYSISLDSLFCAVYISDSNKVVVYDDKENCKLVCNVKEGIDGLFIEKILISNDCKLVLMYTRFKENLTKLGYLSVYSKNNVQLLDTITYAGLDGAFSNENYLFIIHALNVRGSIWPVDSNNSCKLLIYNDKMRLTYSNKVWLFTQSLISPIYDDLNKCFLMYSDFKCDFSDPFQFCIKYRK